MWRHPRMMSMKTLFRPLLDHHDRGISLQSARVLKSGSHGAPQLYGHSIRNQGNHGAQKAFTGTSLCTRSWRHGWKGRNHKHKISSGRWTRLSCLTPISGRTWTCAQESLSLRCKLCVSTTTWKVEPLLSCTICAWVWTSSTVSRLTVSRNPRVAIYMPCSLKGHSLLHHGQSILPHGTLPICEKGPFPSHRGFF